MNMSDDTITLTARQWRMVQTSMTEFRSVSDGEAGASPCSHQEFWQCRTDCVHQCVCGHPCSAHEEMDCEASRAEGVLGFKPCLKRGCRCMQFEEKP